MTILTVHSPLYRLHPKQHDLVAYPEVHSSRRKDNQLAVPLSVQRSWVNSGYSDQSIWNPINQKHIVTNDVSLPWIDGILRWRVSKFILATISYIVHISRKQDPISIIMFKQHFQDMNVRQKRLGKSCNNLKKLQAAYISRGRPHRLCKACKRQALIARTMQVFHLVFWMLSWHHKRFTEDVRKGESIALLGRPQTWRLRWSSKVSP